MFVISRVFTGSWTKTGRKARFAVLLFLPPPAHGQKGGAEGTIRAGLRRGRSSFGSGQDRPSGPSTAGPSSDLPRRKARPDLPISPAYRPLSSTGPALGLSGLYITVIM